MESDEDVFSDEESQGKRQSLKEKTPASDSTLLTTHNNTDRQKATTYIDSP